MEVRILRRDLSGATAISRIDGEEQFAENFRNLTAIDLVDDEYVFLQFGLLGLSLCAGRLLRLDRFVNGEIIGISLCSEGLTEKRGDVFDLREFNVRLKHPPNLVNVQRQLINCGISGYRNIDMAFVHTRDSELVTIYGLECVNTELDAGEEICHGFLNRYFSLDILF